MNILFFGPNGSGKGTQGSILKDKYNTPHIESGAIFRENIGKGTELGAQAKAYIDKGDLVPDEITIPMILDRLQQDDCKNGWLLDGFPRNKNQAIKLDEALKKAGMALDIVVEILLDREIAKNRIMGRRLCVNDNNHPNNIYIDAIKPDGDKCRVCGGDLKLDLSGVTGADLSEYILHEHVGRTGALVGWRHVERPHLGAMAALHRPLDVKARKPNQRVAVKYAVCVARRDPRHHGLIGGCKCFRLRQKKRLGEQTNTL